MESQHSETSETNSKCEFAKINFTDHLSDRMAQLCMSDIYSDVILIVEDQRLPAHKCILAAGNEYFRNLLYGKLKESNQEEIELNVPLKAFKALLQFIYSAKICLSDFDEVIVLDILALANKYGFTELEHAIAIYLKQLLNVSNAWPIFQTAWLCEVKDLKEVCYTLMDRNASNLLAEESFNELSKELLEDVLRRDSFLASEFEIFTALCDWHKHHENVDFDSVLSCVRFPLMNDSELSMVIRESGIASLEKFLDVLEVRGTPKKLPYRAWPGINMSTSELGAKIIRGSWKKNHTPPGNIFPYDPEDIIASYYVIQTDDYDGIVIELGITSIINYIQIRLEEKRFPYFLEVSANQTRWERVIDYRDCSCQLLQSLYFPPKFLKYIKIVGTGMENLKVGALKASYTEIIPKQVNGFIAATIEICGISTEGGVEQKQALFDSNYYSLHSYNSTMQNVRICLNQPYLVGSLRIFFCDDAASNKCYDCAIHVSTNEGVRWNVFTRSNECTTSWKNISFSPRPVVFIEISSKCKFKSTREHYIHFEEVEEAKSNSDDFKTHVA